MIWLGQTSQAFICLDCIIFSLFFKIFFAGCLETRANLWSFLLFWGTGQQWGGAHLRQAKPAHLSVRKEKEKKKWKRKWGSPQKRLTILSIYAFWHSLSPFTNFCPFENHLLLLSLRSKLLGVQLGIVCI